MQEIVYHTNYELEDSYWWFVARNQIVLDIFQKYCKIDPESDVLDVGCGTGGFASKLNQFSNVIGIDMSDLALEYSQKRGLKNLFNIKLDEFPKKDFNIQAITILDVIEHVEDDIQIIKDCYNTLEKNGYMVATVPAYQWMWSKHDEIHMHYRRYNIGDFKKLLENAGFKMLYSSYFNTLLFPAALMKRTLDKVLGKDKSIEQPVEEVSQLLNNLFTKIFLEERNLIPKVSLPFGMSIICVCQK